jgi:hypothetical protein
MSAENTPAGACTATATGGDHVAPSSVEAVRMVPASPCCTRRCVVWAAGSNTATRKSKLPSVMRTGAPQEAPSSFDARTKMGKSGAAGQSVPEQYEMPGLPSTNASSAVPVFTSSGCR